LRVDTSTVYRLARRGDFPRHRLAPGGAVRYVPSEIIEWVKAQKSV
jgi:predicted DNA-binding transcriptional regulator AlpA